MTYPKKQFTPETPTTWFPLEELARRQRVLDNLRERRDSPVPVAIVFLTAAPKELDP